jgi:thioredoxin:protein disulfide reductase
MIDIGITMNIQIIIRSVFTLLLALFSSLGFAEDFLDPSLAFKLESERVGDEVLLKWKIAPGYHLYGDRIEVKASDPKTVLGELKKPAGEQKFDANFGKVMTHYSGDVELKLPLVGLPPGAEKLELAVISQGCADAGLCYPPQETMISVAATSLSAAAAKTPPSSTQAASSASALSTAPAKPAAGSSAAVTEESSDEEKISSTLQSGSIWKIALMFFGLGLLLSFTPCVLPMIPILSSIILGSSGANGGPASRGRGFALSLAYSLGMILIYTSMGVAAGLLGEGLAATLQKPWVIALFATLLFGFGLAMFDVFTLEMPSGVQNRLTEITNRIPGGKFTGVFAMGGLSALIVGPCVAAPLAGTLVYISKTGNVLIGGIALFCLSLGMSQPLLLTGLSAGKLLPKAGAWMDGVKRFFGLLLFGTALWLANPILPQVVFVAAIAVLLLMAASWLSAFSPMPAGSGLAKTAGKAVGLLCAGMAVLQLVGLASGGRDAMQPIKHLAQSRGQMVAGAALAGQPAKALRFDAVASSQQLQDVLAKSKGPVVLDFYADWCTSCKEMEHGTFTDPRVVEMMGKATLVRADVTKNSADDKALMKRYGLFGPPALLVLQPNGEEVTKARVIGYKAAEPFLAQLGAVLK